MSRRQYYIFLAEMELHGILTFSSEIRPAVAGVGAVHITSHFIHNYPLIYAFNRRIAEAYVVIPSLHLPFQRKQARKLLQYTFVSQVLEEIRMGSLDHVYAYPASPIKVTLRKFFLSAKGYGYVEKVKRQMKHFYPTETNWVSLVPPTKHFTLLISPRKLPEKLYVRIGMKRTGLFKVKLTEIPLTRIRVVDSIEWSSIPVNFSDVRLFNYIVEDYVKVLETRSQPEGKCELDVCEQDRHGANVIGYIRARGLYELDTPMGRLLVPLPKTLPLQGGV